jgi:hypothetical protein
MLNLETEITWKPERKNMDFSTISTALTPGEIVAVESEELPGEIIGWLIGRVDGSSFWIGQMISADLTDACVIAELHDEPTIWGAVVSPGSIEIVAAFTDDDLAEEWARLIAAGIRAEIARVMQ